MISHLSKITTVYPVPPIFSHPFGCGPLQPRWEWYGQSLARKLPGWKQGWQPAPTGRKGKLTKLMQGTCKNQLQHRQHLILKILSTKDPSPFGPRRHLHPVAIPATAPHWKHFLAWKIWKNLPFNSASGAVRGQPLMTEAVTWKEASQKQVNRWIIAVCHRAWSHQHSLSVCLLLSTHLTQNCQERQQRHSIKCSTAESGHENKLRGFFSCSMSLVWIPEEKTLRISTWVPKCSCLFS